MVNSKVDGNKKFQKLPFSTLVKKDKELSGIRWKYALKSKTERRAVADWEYHSEIANDLFNAVLTKTGEEEFRRSYWPVGVISLAIDPLYAPAILTVGSMEYQLGRREEAMNLFLTLTELPEDEEELSTIIDKAGDFLINNGDFENALKLYTVAERRFPNNVLYLIGSGYCLSKLGRYIDSVKKYRCAIKLEPNNYKYLNDLGYSLLEAGKFDECEQYLKKSISLAPKDYKFPHNNLKELKKRKMARIVQKIQINGRELNALFDTGSLRSYICKEFEPPNTRKVPSIRVSIGGKTLNLDRRCDVSAVINGLEFDFSAYIVDELGEIEEAHIDALIGALCMEEWWIKLDPKSRTLDLSNLRRREFTEYLI